jgi:hypothetical protein
MMEINNLKDFCHPLAAKGESSSLLIVKLFMSHSNILVKNVIFGITLRGWMLTVTGRMLTVT